MRTKSRVEFTARWGEWTTRSMQAATIVRRIEEFVAKHNLSHDDAPVAVTVRNAETDRSVVVDIECVWAADEYAPKLESAKAEVGA